MEECCLGMTAIRVRTPVTALKQHYLRDNQIFFFKAQGGIADAIGTTLFAVRVRLPDSQCPSSLLGVFPIRLSLTTTASEAKASTTTCAHHVDAVIPHPLNYSPCVLFLVTPR